MKELTTRSPVRFAILVTLALFVVDGALALVVPRFFDDERVLQVSQDIGQYALAIGLLTSLGWWRRAGFTKLPDARSLLVVLPLLIIPAIQLLAFDLGTHDTVMIVVIIEAAIAAGFTEEALFRGVILRALEPIGLFAAAVLSSVLFGVVHLVNLVAGADLLLTVDQVVSAGALGFAFAAVVLVTGRIWPVIVIHAGMDILGMLMAGDFINREPSTLSIVQVVVSNVVFTALFAGYGYWLLRRHLRQAAQTGTGEPGATSGAPGQRVVAGS